MGKIKLIRQFVETIVDMPITIARERFDWGMMIDCRKPRLCLPSNLLQNTEVDKLFRKDFTARCAQAKGFSNVTISLLHEIGHWETRDKVDWEAYYNDRVDVYGIDYFKLDAEQQATNWAIQWLRNPANRKFAKAFEKKFFTH